MPLMLLHGARPSPPDAAGPGIVLVEPSGEHARRDLLRLTAEHPVVHARTTTLSGLAEIVLAAAGRAPSETTSPVSMRLALLDALEQPGVADSFGPAARAPGMSGVLERAVTELRDGGVSALDVESVAANDREHALAEIVGRVEKLSIRADRLREAAAAAGELAAFPAVEVVGFDDLDPAAWDLLAALGGVTDVTARLIYVPERHAFAARHDRFLRWQQAADESREAAPGEPGSFAALAARVYEDGPPVNDAPLRLVGASGTRGMLRAAFEHVRERIIAGVRPGDCAVVVPRLAELRDDIDRLAADWELPIRRRARVRVLEAPLMLAIVHLLHLGELEPTSRGALDHLLGWLRTPYSAAEPAAVDDFEIDMRRGDRDTRATLIGRWNDDVIAPAVRLTAAGKSGPRAQLAALLEIGHDALTRVVGSDMPTRADLRDRAALDVLGGVASAFADNEGNAGEPVTTARGPLPPGALGELIADLTFVEENGPADGVAIHDYTSFRGHRYPHVVLTGLDGAGIPGRPSADPLLGDLRERLSELPPRAPGTSEHRLRFVHALGAATESLTLIRRTADDDGRELAPSPYWIEACRVAAREPDDFDATGGTRGELPESVEVAATEREALRLMALVRKAVPGLSAEALERRVRRRGLEPGDLDHITEIRVTALQNYLGCPYGWLWSGVLAPEEIARPQDAASEGSFLHEILEQLYRHVSETDPGPCDPERLPRYLDALPDAIEAARAKHTPGDAGAAWQATVERARAHVEALLRREAAMRPAMRPSLFEQKVRSETILGDVDPPLALTGTIDRVDLSADGSRGVVVDYKRSGNKAELGKHDAAEILQILLYPALAEESVDGLEAVDGGLYVGVLRASHTGAVAEAGGWAAELPSKVRVADEDWAQACENLLAELREAARGIRAGHVDAPPEKGCPPWCEHGALYR